MACPPKASYGAPIGAVSTVHQPPDYLRRGGAGEIGDAERGQRVEDGVGNGREGGDRAGFTAAFDPEGVSRAAGAVEADMKGWQVVGARHCIVHERAGDQLTRTGIVDGVLEQGLADALGDRAMRLARGD